MLSTRKTKIICTLGPAVDNEDTIRTLIRTGMDAARFNFSHGSHEEHLARLTMLKSVPLRRRQMGFSLCREDGYRRVAAYLNQCGTDIDRSKFISYMLGVFAEEVDELEFLLGSLHVDHPRERMHYLLRGEGLGCYYLLFKAMRQTEHDRDLLTGCCRFLMRKGDALSFNLASVAKVYFDLPQVKGSFSLKLDPYQLGRLEMSYASFRRVMQSI